MSFPKQHKFYLHGILRTLSPLHIAAPGKGHLDMADGRVKFGAHAGNDFPATLIQKMPVAVPGEGGWQYLPVISANNIMGHLRRHAAAIVCGKFLDNGEMVSPAAFNVLNCGAASGKPDAEGLTFADYQANKNHLYMGLLGGGPALMRRYVQCNNLVPKTDASAAMIEAFPHPLGIEATTHSADKLTYGWMVNHLDDLERMAHPELSHGVIKDFAQEFIERNERIKNQRDLKKEAKKDGIRAPAAEKDSTRAVFGLEFVVPLVEFPVMWQLNVNRAQLGLFLKMLERFVAHDRLGGWSRNGFGQFVLNELTLSGDLIDDEDGSAVEPIGDLIQNRALNASHPFVARTIELFEEALERTTAADLEAMLFPKLAA
jgi:CRISPR type IV-associated protein Csf2